MPISETHPAHSYMKGNGWSPEAGAMLYFADSMYTVLEEMNEKMERMEKLFERIVLSLDFKAAEAIRVQNELT